MNISQFVKKNQEKRTTQPKTNVMDAISSYSKMSEEDLMAQFITEANREKANGTFDKATLEQFYLTASTMLTPEQKAKMRALIDQIS